MHRKNDDRRSKQFPKHLYKEHLEHRLIDQGKYRKKSIKRKWIEREYYVQDNAHVAQKDVKIYCDTNQFPGSPFCGPHPKSHRARGLIKH